MNKNRIPIQKCNACKELGVVFFAEKYKQGIWMTEGEIYDEDMSNSSPVLCNAEEIGVGIFENYPVRCT